MVLRGALEPVEPTGVPPPTRAVQPQRPLCPCAGHFDGFGEHCSARFQTEPPPNVETPRRLPTMGRAAEKTSLVIGCAESDVEDCFLNTPRERVLKALDILDALPGSNPFLLSVKIAKRKTIADQPSMEFETACPTENSERRNSYETKVQRSTTPSKSQCI